MRRLGVIEWVALALLVVFAVGVGWYFFSSTSSPNADTVNSPATTDSSSVFVMPSSNTRSGSTQTSSSASGQSQSETRYGVQFTENYSLEDGRTLVEQLGGHVFYELPLTHVLVIRIDDASARKTLREAPSVLSVRAEIVLTLLSRGTLAASFGPKASSASKTQPDNSVNIYVLDSGADPNFSYASVDSVVSEWGTKDILGHGTVVTSVLSNKLADQGTNNTRIHSIKVTDDSGVLTDFTLAEGLQKAMNNGADIINLSVAIPPEGVLPGSDLDQALNKAKDNGIIVVVGAGNDPTLVNGLAAHSAAISVGALWVGNSAADYSGGAISSDKADFFASGDVFDEDGKYVGSGTSYADPAVTALVDQVVQQPIPKAYDINGNGRWDVEEVKTRLADGLNSGEYLGAITYNKADLTLLEDTHATSSSDLAIVNPDGTFGKVQSVSQPAANTNSSNACSGAWYPGSKCGIVPQCAFGGGTGPYCQACDVVKLVNNLIAFAVYFSAFIATIMFAYAGFLYVTAASNPENINKAKSIFGKVLLGFVFVLTAWLIIDIILSTFTNKNFGFWTDLKCEAPPTLSDATGTTVGNGSLYATGADSSGSRCTVGTDPDCLSQTQAALLLSQAGISVESSGNCSDQNNSTCTSLEGMRKSAIDDMIALKKNLGVNFDVSGGTEAGHSAACQSGGSCPDINFSTTYVGTPGNYNADNINKIIETSKQLGRCPVFEPAAGSSCPTGVSSCQEVSWAKGDGHFSFYECK